jgi:uncharacterized protein with PIN domain
MLGSLARWLRMFGYDCAFFATELDDPELAVLAQKEGRWLLTRDRELAASGPRTVLIRSTDLDEQLREVLQRRRLQPRPDLVHSRCSACNGELAATTAEQVAGQVPPHVAKTVDSYKVCCDCGRIYWRGSHTERIVARMERVCT